MEEAGHETQNTARKNAELEELWASNTAEESQNAGMLGYHNAIRFLHKKTQEDNNVKRDEY